MKKKTITKRATTSGQRRPDGKFLPGHTVKSPGNPHAIQIGMYRDAIRNAVSEDDLRRVFATLKRLAVRGDIDAIRELLNRTLGNRVPLSADLVQQLRAHVRMKSPDAPILPVPNKTAWMLRQDMIAARAAWIAAAKKPAEHEQRARSPFLEVERDTDRFLPFDFHSLRGTASVLLQQAGVPIGFVQRILNHKTPLITIGNYTNPDLGTLAQKMNASPPLAVAAS